MLPDMVEARLSWTSPTVKHWYAESTLKEQLGRGLAVEAGRIDSLAFGGPYRDQVGLLYEQTGPWDWANRVVDLPDGGWAVTGIRFRGQDLTRPFVDVVASTTPPTADGLAVLAEAVVDAYRVFSPRCLRVEAPDPSALVTQVTSDPRFGVGSGVDQYVVAGLVANLRARPHTPAFDFVTLRAAPAESMAERTATIYRERLTGEPQSALWARPEDVESLAGSAAEGLLFEALVDGAPAGVVAAIRADAHGLAGFSVQEVCLDHHHRGRRLATGVIQRLLAQLQARPGDVLWGTIHPANLPSLRNALSVGRQVVGAKVWITPYSLPGMPTTTPVEAVGGA